MENQLRDSTEFYAGVSDELKKAAEPKVVEIEKTLDEAVKQMGSMTEDAFFHLENREFAKACEQCDYGPSQLAEQSEKDDRRTGDYTAAVGCFQVRFLGIFIMP